MTVAFLGAPVAVEAQMAIPQGVDFESWMNWVDPVDGSTMQLGLYSAVLSFSVGRVGEVVPAPISNTTVANTVGRITLANVSPNMKLFIPAVVTAALSFGLLRAVLDVTDAGGRKTRWVEAKVTLDRGTGL